MIGQVHAGPVALYRFVVAAGLCVSLVVAAAPPVAAEDTRVVTVDYGVAFGASVEGVRYVGLEYFPNTRCGDPPHYGPALPSIGSASFRECHFGTTLFSVDVADDRYGADVAILPSGCNGLEFGEETTCYRGSVACGSGILETPVAVEHVIVFVFVLHVEQDLGLCLGSSGNVTLTIHCGEPDQLCRGNY